MLRRRGLIVCVLDRSSECVVVITVQSKKGCPRRLLLGNLRGDWTHDDESGETVVLNLFARQNIQPLLQRSVTGSEAVFISVLRRYPGRCLAMRRGFQAGQVR